MPAIAEVKTTEAKTTSSDTPITPAVAEAVTRDIYSRLRVKPTPSKAKAKDEKPAELEKKVEAAAPEKPAETPAVTTPAKPAAKKKAAAPEPTRVTLDAKELGDVIVKGLAPALKPAEVAKDEPKLPPIVQERVRIYEQMGKANPAHKGLAAEYLDRLKRVEAYQKQWESENKGKRFNKDDSEHEEFFQSNDLLVDDDEYRKAERELIKQEVLEEVSGKIKPEIDELKARETTRERIKTVEPLARAHQLTSERILFEELGEDFKGVIDDKGAQSDPEIERLLKEKPILSKMGFNAARKIGAVTGSMYRMAHDVEKFNPQNNTHVEAFRFLDEVEAEMKQKPVDDQIQDGKQFATGEEWGAMTPEQRNKHWRYSVEELSALYAIREADKVKEAATNYEKDLEAVAAARGYKKPESNGATNGNHVVKEEPKPAPRSPSPAGTIEPRMTTPAKPSGDSGLTIFDRLKGKKVAV